MNFWKQFFSADKKAPNRVNPAPNAAPAAVSSSSPGINPGTLSNDERNRILAARGLEFLQENMGDVESGKNNPLRIGLTISGVDNQGILELSKRGEWLVTIGVYRRGTDKLYSHYLCQGDKDKVLAYLRDESSREELYNSLQELSDRIDQAD